jgi:hypothetical protein
MFLLRAGVLTWLVAYLGVLVYAYLGPKYEA